MCGITGHFFFTNEPVSEEKLKSATAALQHRGPDNEGVYVKDGIGFGHRRLAIIDLSERANQPFRDPSGRYMLTYNGEVYNFKDLRAELEKKGIEFRSHSDTEVVLHGLIQEGESFLNKLNGFFALGFADTEQKTLLLARDRFGIKPVYYYADEAQIAFSSELKPLLKLVPNREIDPKSLSLYLRFNYIPAPRTILKQFRKLPPGHMIKVWDNQLTLAQYYKPEERLLREEEYSDEHLKKLLFSAVRKRMVADVPVGSFLSGGIDSSIIASIAKQYKPDLQTFSIGFEGNDWFDESAYAQEVAQRIGTQHKTINISAAQLTKSASELPLHLDEPFADSSSIAVHALCAHARKFVPVALSGDGADELFGGYNKHRALLRSLNAGPKERLMSSIGTVVPGSGGRDSALGNKLRQLKKFSSGMKLNPVERYLQWASFCSEETLERLTEQSTPLELADLIHTRWTGEFEDFLRMDQELVLPNDMLKKVDSMSMAHSLEVRTPFLDHRVVEYARSIPWQLKLNQSKGKLPLRSAFKDMLPEMVFDRPKHGFEVPLSSWIKTDLAKEIDHYLDPSMTNTIGLLNSEEVNRSLKKSRSSQPGESAYQVWAIFVLHKWIEENLL